MAVLLLLRSRRSSDLRRQFTRSPANTTFHCCFFFAFELFTALLLRLASHLRYYYWPIRFGFHFLHAGPCKKWNPHLIGRLALKFVCHSYKHFGACLYLTLQNPLDQKCYLFSLCCFVSFGLLLFFVFDFFVCLFVCLFLFLVFYIPATMFSYLQFGLNVGLVGVTYCAITLTYAVGTIITGPITDRLVRSTLHTAGFVGLDSHRISPFTSHLPSHTHVQKRPRYFIITGLVIAGAGFQFIGPAEFITSP